MNHLALKGRIKAVVIDHRGHVVREYPSQSNLILDQGLDRIAEMPIVDIFAYAAKGTGMTPAVYTPSGTISQALNTVSASSGTAFEAADVGRVLRWFSGTGAGKEKRIMSFTDGSHVEVNGEPETIAAGSFKKFAVNETGLDAENGPRTNDYSSGVNENFTTTVGNKRTLKRTFIFAPETATTIYNEVGFSHDGTPGNNLNIRVKLNTGVSVAGPVGAIPGQRLKLTYEMDVYATPNVSTVANLAGIITDPGQDMSSNKNANYIVETFATSRIALSGERDITLADLEPFTPGFMAFSTDTTALAFNNNAQRVANNDYVALEFLEDYVAGSFSRLLTGTFDLEDANRNDLRSLMLFNPESNNAIVTYLFGSNQRKDPNHSLTIIWRKSWGRDLS